MTDDGLATRKDEESSCPSPEEVAEEEYKPEAVDSTNIRLLDRQNSFQATRKFFAEKGEFPIYFAAKLMLPKYLFFVKRHDDIAESLPAEARR